VQSLTANSSFQFLVFDAALLNAPRLSSGQERAMEMLAKLPRASARGFRLNVFRATEN
jgi:hypothetical protein